MRRIQLKHFSTASCWSKFSLSGCSCGKSSVPHISGIFQLCLGCCSHSACGHEPSLLGHAGSGLQHGLCSSWVGFLGWILVFWEGWCSTSQGHGGIVLAEPSRSLLISESTELRVKRWISCLSLGKNKLWVSAQDRGAASWQWIPPSYRGCIDPLPFGKCCAQAGGVAFVWSFSWGSYCSCAEVCSPTDAGDSWFAFVRGIKLFSRLTTASALRNFIL